MYASNWKISEEVSYLLRLFSIATSPVFMYLKQVGVNQLFDFRDFTAYGV